jgi:hypothetical protein
MMAWGSIPDISIRNVLEALHDGRLDPTVKTYIFKLKDGRHFGVGEKTEAGARDYCDYKGYQIESLVNVDPITINGMTIDEIKLEAKNRGIERGNE